MKFVIKRASTLIFLYLTLSVVIGHAGPLDTGFSAEYQVKRNDMYLGVSLNTLRKLNDSIWEYRAEVEPRGFVAIFISDHVSDVSKIQFINDHVQPLSYVHHHKKSDSDKIDELHFDWEKHQVHINQQPTPVELPAFSQDVLSFQLELMKLSQQKLESYKMPVANHRGVEIYDLQFKGPEQIEVPFGKYSAYRFEALDKDKDRHILWLAKELDFFPVKIQNIDSDGVVVDIELKTLNIKAGVPPVKP